MRTLVTSSCEIASTEELVTTGQNVFVVRPPRQSYTHRTGIVAGCEQLSCPTIGSNAEVYSEYRKQHRSATPAKKVSEPAQRRREAEDRTACVFRLPTLPNASSADISSVHYQRVFCGRKHQLEQRLEARLSALELQSNSLDSDNRRPKCELLKARNENTMLRSIV